jgi:hypothetical protein
LNAGLKHSLDNAIAHRGPKHTAAGRAARAAGCRLLFWWEVKSRVARVSVSAAGRA